MRCPFCGEQNAEGQQFCTSCGKAIGSMIKLVMIYGLVGAVVALVTGPIPGTSLILSGIEIILVYDIAKRYGVHLALTEIGCATVGLVVLGLGLKLLVSTLLEFVPVLGWWIGKPLVAFATIFILGLLADKYFRDRQIMTEQKRGVG